MSSSKSSQSTSQFDNRRTMGEGAISAEDSNVNVWNTTVDRDIVNRALASVDTNTGQALRVAGDTFADAFGFGDSALGFGKQALATSSDAFSDALGFADSLTARTGTSLANMLADSLGFADSQAARTNTTVSNAFADLMGSQDSLVAKVLNYGGTMTSQVADSFAASTDLVKDAYADAKGRGALTDKILIGTIAAMALVAYMALKK